MAGQPISTAETTKEKKGGLGLEPPGDTTRHIWLPFQLPSWQQECIG